MSLTLNYDQTDPSSQATVKSLQKLLGDKISINAVEVNNTNINHSAWGNLNHVGRCSKFSNNNDMNNDIPDFNDDATTTVGRPTISSNSSSNSLLTSTTKGNGPRVSNLDVTDIDDDDQRETQSESKSIAFPSTSPLEGQVSESNSNMNLNFPRQHSLNSLGSNMSGTSMGINRSRSKPSISLTLIGGNIEHVVTDNLIGFPRESNISNISLPEDQVLQTESSKVDLPQIQKGRESEASIYSVNYSKPKTSTGPIVNIPNLRISSVSSSSAVSSNMPKRKSSSYSVLPVIRRSSNNTGIGAGIKNRAPSNNIRRDLDSFWFLEDMVNTQFQTQINKDDRMSLSKNNEFLWNFNYLDSEEEEEEGGPGSVRLMQSESLNVNNESKAISTTVTPKALNDSARVTANFGDAQTSINDAGRISEVVQGSTENEVTADATVVTLATTIKDSDELNEAKQQNDNLNENEEFKPRPIDSNNTVATEQFTDQPQDQVTPPQPEVTVNVTSPNIETPRFESAATEENNISTPSMQIPLLTPPLPQAPPAYIRESIVTLGDDGKVTEPDNKNQINQVMARNSNVSTISKNALLPPLRLSSKPTQTKVATYVQAYPSLNLGPLLLSKQCQQSKPKDSNFKSSNTNELNQFEIEQCNQTLRSFLSKKNSRSGKYRLEIGSSEEQGDNDNLIGHEVEIAVVFDRDFKVVSVEQDGITIGKSETGSDDIQQSNSYQSKSSLNLIHQYVKRRFSTSSTILKLPFIRFIKGPNFKSIDPVKSLDNESAGSGSEIDSVIQTEDSEEVLTVNKKLLRFFTSLKKKGQSLELGELSKMINNSNSESNSASASDNVNITQTLNDKFLLITPIFQHSFIIRCDLFVDDMYDIKGSMVTATPYTQYNQELDSESSYNNSQKNSILLPSSSLFSTKLLSFCQHVILLKKLQGPFLSFSFQIVFQEEAVLRRNSFINSINNPRKGREDDRILRDAKIKLAKARHRSMSMIGRKEVPQYQNVNEDPNNQNDSQIKLKPPALGPKMSRMLGITVTPIGTSRDNYHGQTSKLGIGQLKFKEEVQKVRNSRLSVLKKYRVSRNSVLDSTEDNNNNDITVLKGRDTVQSNSSSSVSDSDEQQQLQQVPTITVTAPPKESSESEDVIAEATKFLTTNLATPALDGTLSSVENTPSILVQETVNTELTVPTITITAPPEDQENGITLDQDFNQQDHQDDDFDPFLAACTARASCVSQPTPIVNRRSNYSNRPGSADSNHSLQLNHPFRCNLSARSNRSNRSNISNNNSMPISGSRSRGRGKTNNNLLSVRSARGHRSARRNNIDSARSYQSYSSYTSHADSSYFSHSSYNQNSSRRSSGSRSDRTSVTSMYDSYQSSYTSRSSRSRLSTIGSSRYGSNPTPSIMNSARSSRHYGSGTKKRHSHRNFNQNSNLKVLNLKSLGGLRGSDYHAYGNNININSIRSISSTASIDKIPLSQRLDPETLIFDNQGQLVRVFLLEVLDNHSHQLTESSESSDNSGHSNECYRDKILIPFLENQGVRLEGDAVTLGDSKENIENLANKGADSSKTHRLRLLKNTISRKLRSLTNFKKNSGKHNLDGEATRARQQLVYMLNRVDVEVQ